MGLRACLNGRGKFPFTGIQSPDRRVRSESLYRLSYRGAVSAILYIFTYMHIQGQYCLLAPPLFQIAVLLTF